MEVLKRSVSFPVAKEKRKEVKNHGGVGQKERELFRKS